MAAEGRALDAAAFAEAARFLDAEVTPSVTATGDSNGLGFVIIHPGSMGQSISAHWWVQGAVLCQKIYRKLYADAAPLPMADRPVVACVWELDLIQREQTAWRRTMMVAAPDRTAYLASRPGVDQV